MKLIHEMEIRSLLREDELTDTTWDTKENIIKNCFQGNLFRSDAPRNPIRWQNRFGEGKKS